MNLTPQQHTVLLRFYNRFLPLQSPYVYSLHPSIRRRRFEGCSILRANTLVRGLCAGIFAEYPQANVREFEQHMRARIRRLRPLISSQERKRGSGDATGLISNYLENVSGTGLPFEEQMRSLRFYLRFYPLWMKTPVTHFGDYSMQVSLEPHAEAPLSLELRNREGKILATIGGYVHRAGAAKVIRLTNVQGMAFRNGEDLESHLAQYRKLSEALGENWRVALVKRAIDVAQAHGFQLLAEEPRRYAYGGVDTPSESEYRRQVRQYQQTYKKAGLAPHSSRVWTFPSTKEKGTEPSSRL